MNRRAPPGGTQAVLRAIRLLKSFEYPSEELTLSQLSTLHGLARPTAHRILAALESEGLLDRNEETSAYRLSPIAAYFAGGDHIAGGAPAAPSVRGRSLESPYLRSMPQTTPFHSRILDRHESHDWRAWSGYISPTLYEPTFTREYYAIRNTAALIDVTPLFKYEVTGRDAFRLVQRTMTRDFGKCRVGQVMYSSWCDDDGKLVQDGNVIRLAEDHFRISAADPSLGWLEDCAGGRHGMEVQVREVTQEIGALSLQGPRSFALLDEAVDGIDVASLGYFRWAEASCTGRPLLISRTGFTGDLGYELWMAAKDAGAVWDRLLKVGESYGLLPVGLMAMDAARIEAGLVLIEVDYVSSIHAFLEGRKSSPYEAGLGWTVKLVEDNPFIGRRALEVEKSDGSEWAMVGVEISWSELEGLHGEAGLRPQSVGQPPCRDPMPLYVQGEQIGQITSQTFSPILKKQIGLATVKALHAQPATEVEVEMMVDRSRVRAKGHVAKLPFYDPPHKRAKERELKELNEKMYGSMR